MQLIQKLRDNKKCMKKVEPSSRSKAIKDIISIGSFVEALVLNHYVLVRKIFFFFWVSSQRFGRKRKIDLKFVAKRQKYNSTKRQKYNSDRQRFDRSGLSW
ncbi:hypothetical protein Tco_0041907 [Tanacetum coccineum]